MSSIKFDLGKNIVETAKDSGASGYATRDVAGYISYGLVDLPPKDEAHYVRPGYEIAWSPLFALTMYADHGRSSDDLVETVDLQLSNKALTSHEEAQNFIEKTIGQFQRGKWRRFISDNCPRVSGRSSLLNLQGQLAPNSGCSPDPAYRMSRDEWLHMMAAGQRYQWIGDDVLAELRVTYRQADAYTGLTYEVYLSFDRKKAKDEIDAKNLADELKEGDAKGWNSTVKYKADGEKRAELNKQLEANAVKRGDSVVPGP